MSVRWRKDKRSLLMKMGYSVYDKVRCRLAKDHDWLCGYCGDTVVLRTECQSGKNLATIEHKIPLSRGGGWKRFNLGCACRGCSNEKGNMTQEEYRFYLHFIGRG